MAVGSVMCWLAPRDNTHTHTATTTTLAPPGGHHHYSTCSTMHGGTDNHNGSPKHLMPNTAHAPHHSATRRRHTRRHAVVSAHGDAECSAHTHAHGQTCTLNSRTARHHAHGTHDNHGILARHGGTTTRRVLHIVALSGKARGPRCRAPIVAVPWARAL